MASIIKNQIFKRLTKFVKNLSTNQINLSTIKGEGELSSIELDEKVLEDLVELPTWLKIQRATCGRVFIKIPWTNLKTLPIQLQLDDVDVEIETSETLREINNSLNTNDPLIGKYGFINRVIDGISLNISNVTFSIKSKGFKATIYLPSLDIYSTNPNGKRTDSLVSTRLRNKTKDHILLFKEIFWPNARIEATSNESNSSIRFIANTCRIRISMKKNLQDSSLVTSRMIVNFEDFLSVINDAQLKSILNTYKEITQLMKRASEQRKNNAADKLTKLDRQTSSIRPTNQVNVASTTEPQSNDSFSRFDIIETSLHFSIKRFDLHIITDSDTSSPVDRIVENGAIQITIANLSIQHYPYHLYGTSRKHWIKYSEAQSMNRHEWTTKLHEKWKEEFTNAKLSVINDETSLKFEKALRTNRIRLLESCSLINIDDIAIYPVSLNNDKQHRRRRPFMTSDKMYYHLPDFLGILNIQFTEYYYPSPYSFPVPNSDLSIHLMPFVIRVDLPTFIWLDALISTISITIDDSGVLKLDGSHIDREHISTLFEALLPRIESDHLICGPSNQSVHLRAKVLIGSDIFSNENSETLELSVSKITVTNTDIESICSTNKLKEDVTLFKHTDFFRKLHTTSEHISSIFEKHPYETYLYKNPLNDKITSLDEASSAKRALHTYYTMTTDSLKKSAKYDIWYFNLEKIYLDFTSNRFGKQNMISNLSLDGWSVFDENEKDFLINLLCLIRNSSVLKLSQHQYTFIMNLSDEFDRFLDLIEQNKNKTNSIKEKFSLDSSTKVLKLKVCLTTSHTFVLAIIDDANSLIPSPINLPEIDIEQNTKHETIDIPIIHETNTKPPDSIHSHKVSHNEMNLIPRTSSLSINDDTMSVWDSIDDLDADFDVSSIANEIEQHKVERIDIDDESSSLMDRYSMETMSFKCVNGVFLKLNQIHIFLTIDEENPKKPISILLNIKYLRIDEFYSLKYDSIKPKLFENESPDEMNDENVPPIVIRIDLISPPIIKLNIQDRLIKSTNHSIDLVVKNLEDENTDKVLSQTKTLPIEIQLNNVQILLEIFNQHNSIEDRKIIKPPTKMNIQSLKICRSIDGQIQIDNNRSIASILPNENSDELEYFRRENERLRSELIAQQNEINLLIDQRDSLMKTVSRLDIKLSEFEYSSSM